MKTSIPDSEENRASGGWRERQQQRGNKGRTKEATVLGDRKG
jgi:hypothetical protein